MRSPALKRGIAAAFGVGSGVGAADASTVGTGVGLGLTESVGDEVGVASGGSVQPINAPATSNMNLNR